MQLLLGALPHQILGLHQSEQRLLAAKALFLSPEQCRVLWPAAVGRSTVSKRGFGELLSRRRVLFSPREAEVAMLDCDLAFPLLEQASYDFRLRAKLQVPQRQGLRYAEAADRSLSILRGASQRFVFVVRDFEES